MANPFTRRAFTEGTFTMGWGRGFLFPNIYIGSKPTFQYTHTLTHTHTTHTHTHTHAHTHTHTHTHTAFFVTK